MSAWESTLGGLDRPVGRRLAAIVGFAGLAAIVAWWMWRTFSDHYTLDLGLAYQAGQLAWTTGHPEHLASWDGMPFLGAAMALISRVISQTTTSDLLTVLNLALVLGTVGVALHRLRSVLTPVWWWVAAFALLSFGPLMSSVWWKQFNIISLALALASFELLRRGRTQLSGGLLGLSVSIKPLAFLLPVVLLARRETRRAGAIAIGWIIVLNMAAQALMAARAGSFSAINPYIPLHNFAQKSEPANIWACHPENFAPGSLLCRLAGAQNWTLQHVVVLAGVALIGAWVIEALRGHGVRWLSWEMFAFTMPLSVMLSPLAWSHYQIMLAPLFLLLLVRFTREGAGAGSWAGLVVAFLLASLLWQPFGTSVGAVRKLVSGKVETQQDLFAVEAVAQFAQYVLMITGALWYAQRRRLPTGDRAVQPAEA